jgi:hypothetical protein
VVIGNATDVGTGTGASAATAIRLSAAIVATWQRVVTNAASEPARMFLPWRDIISS